MRVRTLLLFGAALAAATSIGCGPAPGVIRSRADDLQVVRGSLQPRLLLTGEVEAEQSIFIGAPRSYRPQITWLEEDGAEVRQGDRLVAFDGAEVESTIEGKRLALLRAARELDRARAQVTADTVRAQLAVERARIEVAKAELDASVPQILRSQREHEEHQLNLARSRAELEKARQDLEVERRVGAADIDVESIELERVRRELAAAEQAIDELTNTAPRDGIFVVSELPWEGRKVDVGDTVWPGLSVGSIPILDTMQVRALLADVDDGTVEIGMAALCTLDTYPDLEFEGIVKDVTLVAEARSRHTQRRTFEVVVALDRSDTSRMRPGMSVRVEIPLAAHNDAVLVPRSALDLSADPPRVRLATGGWHSVVLGPCSAQSCVVETALEPGTPLVPVGTGS